MINALLIIFVVYLVLISVRRSHSFSKVLSHSIYAHRGFYSNKVFPCENTLEAFSLAVKNGYGIEFDVQLTQDNVPIVFHDNSLNRMLGIDKLVKDLDYSYISSLKLPCGNTIPTLEEVLSLVDGSVPLLVEIKHHAGANKTSEAAYKVLKNYSGAYTVESFNPVCLYWFRKNAPNIIRGQLSSGDFSIEDIENPILRFALKYMLLNIVSAPNFIAYKYSCDKNLSMAIMKYFFKPVLAAYTLKYQSEFDNAVKEAYTMLIFEGFKPERHS